MKSEQARIASELSNANDRLGAMSTEFNVVEENLEQAVALAADWHDAVPPSQHDRAENAQPSDLRKAVRRRER